MAYNPNRFYSRTTSGQSLPPMKSDSVPLMPNPVSLAAPAAAPEGPDNIHTLAQEDQVHTIPSLV
jgi:hypothetical protein